MELHVRLSGRGDLTAQIYRQVRAAILDGRLGPGEKLPPTRELALRLDVSRNTVSLAYEWLASEGLLSGRAGAGSFVKGQPAPKLRSRAAAGGPLRRRAVWSAIQGPPERAPDAAYDFGVGAPDARLFPFDEWRRLVARQIRLPKLGGAYGDPAGLPRLRAAIARHVSVSRGVRAGEDDVLVTQGAQQALDLVGRVLLEPGAQVAVEDPGYPPARFLFESLGARVARVPVDAEGLVVDALPAEARLVYVTPSHQFPLGIAMSHARRLALLDWAERRNALLVEDDYDSEFRFGGRPLETLQALDSTGRVIYVGSFSKVMLPALRLGFLVAPGSLVRDLAAAAFVSGWHCPLPGQGALATFIEEGLLARHIRKMRREYAARHERILTALQRDFTTWLSPLPSEAGMHLCALLRPSRLGFERDVHERALAAGVRFDRLSGYSARSRAGMVLGYGGIATPRIDEGLRRLRACLASFAGG